MNSNRITNFLSVVEIRTKLVSVSSFLLASIYGWKQGGVEFSTAIGLRMLLFLVTTLLVDMGTTAWNTYFDYLRGTDDPRINREPEKVLIHRGVAPGFAFWIAFWLYGLSMIGGIILAVKVGFWIIPIGALCMAVGFFYNAGPLPISHTPAGELFAGGFLGSVLFLITYGVQVAGQYPDAASLSLATVVLASIPSGFAVGSILAVNNACDIEGDRAAGRKTIAVLFGVRPAEYYAVSLAVIASLSGMGLGLLKVVPGFAIYSFGASLLYSLYEFYRMHQRGYSHETKKVNMGSIMRIFVVWNLAYIVSLWA